MTRPIANHLTAAVLLIVAGIPVPAATSSAREASKLLHVGPIAPDLLCLEIQSGRIQPIRQVPYESQPGDRTEQQVNPKTGEPRFVRLIRDGKAIGYLVGRDRRTLSLFEQPIGEPLDVAAADRPDSYLVTSEGDLDYRAGVSPSAVWRKTKTNNWADSGAFYTSRHYLYLKLPHPLKPGKAYSLRLRLNTEPSTLEYVHDPDVSRSEAVHVSHIGFRPDDPGKSASSPCGSAPAALIRSLPDWHSSCGTKSRASASTPAKSCQPGNWPTPSSSVAGSTT